MLHVYKIGGKLSLVFYIVMLYQLWHLCQYGGLRSHALRLMVAALGFAVTFILWLAARKRRQKEYWDYRLPLRGVFLCIPALSTDLLCCRT